MRSLTIGVATLSLVGCGGGEGAMPDDTDELAADAASETDGGETTRDAQAPDGPPRVPENDGGLARVDGAAVGSDAGTTGADAASVRNDASPTMSVAELPPMGRAALDAWLAAGHYKSWKCEGSIMPPRPNGAHGRTRVCANTTMAGHMGDAPFPVGAASVKELYGGGNTITGYAVSRKLREGSGGDRWYWFERVGSSVYADGVGTGLCTGCHAQAEARGGHDYVYVWVR